MKKSSMFVFFGLTLFSTIAHAESRYICTSVVLEAAPAVVINRGGTQLTGTVDELRLHEGQISSVPTRSTGVRAFAFDSGIVHLTSRNGLSDKRIHGVLEINLHDPERSLLKSQTLSRVCEGINLFGHCSGSWDVLQSDVQPVVSTMACAAGE
jgi:hypothetical protein